MLRVIETIDQAEAGQASWSQYSMFSLRFFAHLSASNHFQPNHHSSTKLYFIAAVLGHHPPIVFFQ